MTAKLALEDVPVRSGDDLPAGDLSNVSGNSFIYHAMSNIVVTMLYHLMLF